MLGKTEGYNNPLMIDQINVLTVAWLSGESSVGEENPWTDRFPTARLGVIQQSTATGMNVIAGSISRGWNNKSSYIWYYDINLFLLILVQLRQANLKWGSN